MNADLCIYSSPPAIVELDSAPSITFKYPDGRVRLFVDRELLLNLAQQINENFQSIPTKDTLSA